VVRGPGRRGGSVLRLDLQELPDQIDRALRPLRLAGLRPSGGLGDDGRVRAGRPSFYGAQRRPVFRLSEAVSFQIRCSTQEEIDYYWERLGEGGDPAAQACGWLKDRFGLSWQVVPSMMAEMLTDRDSAKRERMFETLLRMKKPDLRALQAAFESRGGQAAV
jgi:hypothetical protein